MRAFIVDDEQPARDELCFLLSEHDDVEVAGMAMSASQALEEISRVRPHVVFQDIQMPGASGFHVLEHTMVLPISSADTAFRAAPLIIADFGKVEQKSIAKRLMIAVCVTYLCVAPEFPFKLAAEVGYPVGIAAAVVCLVAFLLKAKNTPVEVDAADSPGVIG